MMDLPLTSCPFFSTSISEANLLESYTKRAAALACSPSLFFMVNVCDRFDSMLCPLSIRPGYPVPSFFLKTALKPAFQR